MKITDKIMQEIKYNLSGEGTQRRICEDGEGGKVGTKRTE
jgi:hypothetical protein